MEERRFKSVFLLLSHHTVAFLLLLEKVAYMLEKPKRIADDEFQSAKWDEITRGRNFKPSDVPNIAMLCQWYAVAETCMNDITDEAGVHVAYTNDVGDVKALPQLARVQHEPYNPKF